MAFVDTWVVGKEKVCYWLSKDIVGLVGNLVVQEWQSQHRFLPYPHRCQVNTKFNFPKKKGFPVFDFLIQTLSLP